MDLRLKQAGGHAPSVSASASAPVPSVSAPGQRNETPRQSGKRPMRSLTAEEKVNAIDRVHSGESKAAVARDMGVPESTLRGWCKSEEKLRSQARNSGNFERSSPIGSESDRSTASQTPPSDNPLSASGPTKKELPREDTSGLTVKRTRYDNNATSTDVGLVAGGPASSRAYFNGNFRNNLSTYSVFPMNMDLPNNSAVNHQTYLENHQEVLKNMAILRSMIAPFSLNSENGMQNLSQIVNNTLMAATTYGITNNIIVNGANNNSTAKNKRKNNHTTQIPTSKTHKHRLSPDMEKPSTSGSRGASPIASTSMTNGPSNEQTPVRLTRESKGIDDVARNLMVPHKSQQQQLQQSGNYSNELLSNQYLNSATSYEREKLDTIIKNNNNVYNTINENEYITDLAELQQTNLEEAIRSTEKLLNYLDRHGQPLATFAQVDIVRNIYSKLREHKDKNELKKNEVYTS